MLIAFALAAAADLAAQQPAHYFPPQNAWERRAPAELGMDADRLADAVRFAREHDNAESRDVEQFIARSLGNEPHGERIGPFRARTECNGVVVRNGYIVAEWGPIERPDMTFSVTKTYLSTVVGLLFDRGMIQLDEPVHERVPEDLFTTDHARAITWDHLLRQTSDWRGTLWGKPDWADRPTRGMALADLPNQPLREPGSVYEYNDVRVNLLALCALHVWRRPLPQVLREHVMDPIGASSTWRWHGYDDSWVTLDGLRVQSVSGGGHWGGGMIVSTLDHARFGYLFLRGGAWDGKRIVSEEWIRLARTPGESNPEYGFMNWFLNSGRSAGGRERRMIPAAPASAVAFRGAGNNVVYVDVDNDLVVVARWIDGAFEELVAKVLAAIGK